MKELQHGLTIDEKGVSLETSKWIEPLEDLHLRVTLDGRQTFILCHGPEQFRGGWWTGVVKQVSCAECLRMLATVMATPA